MPSLSLVTSLKKIRTKMHAQELSVLVGAGFSKNLDSDKFPSWWQLLNNMVVQIHQKEYDDAFVKSGRAETDKPAFLEDLANRFIDSVGPLKVAALFKQMKGYREALEWYIEQHTPYIDGSELCYNEGGISKRRALTPIDLAVHEQLVNLPWNNIYTTNYDNLLESCIDKETENGLNAQRLDLREKIMGIEATLQQKRNAIAEKEKSLADLQARKTNAIELINSGYVESGPDARLLKEEESAEREIKHLYAAMDRLVDELKNKEEDLNKIERLLRNCITVIKNSSGLALKRHRNIIKLHGSLRLDEDEEFGFDNDPHKHYVITEDDFESYPAKHEAFTQLMRISLLQESFCLIGFSGIDPNFLAWIAWVRDILFKERGKDAEDHKIFLISPDADMPAPEIHGFYNNHRIAFIPLANAESLDFLESAVGRKCPDIKSRRDIISLFLDYLKINSELVAPRIGIEVSMRSKFEKLSEQLPGIKLNIQGDERTEELSTLKQKLNDIFEVIKYNRLPRTNITDYYRDQFLQSKTLGELLDSSKDIDKELLAIHHIIGTQFIPISFIFNDEDPNFHKLLKVVESSSPSTRFKYLSLFARRAIWFGERETWESILKEIDSLKCAEIADELNYLKAQWLASELKFGELRKHLIKWQPSGHWKLNKAGLLSHFDRAASKKLLDEQQPILQEHMYQLEMLTSLRDAPFTLSSEIKNERRQLEQNGLVEIYSQFTALLKEISKSKEKLEPYGADKFKLKRSMTLSRSSEARVGAKVLGLLSASGFQCVFENVQFINREQMYKVAQHTLPFSAHTLLFYILQYSDEKFLRRLGQDYAFTEYLNDIQRNHLCGLVIDAYQDSDTPGRFRSGIAIFLSEFIIAVDPGIWQTFAHSFWEEYKNNGMLFQERVYHRNSFLERGLEFVQDQEIITTMIKDCLQRGVSGPNDMSIQYLYKLGNNPALSASAGRIGKQIQSDLLKMIKRLGQNPELLFLLGNLSALLTQQNIEKIVQGIETFDFSKINNTRLWRQVLFFIGLHEHKNPMDVERFTVLYNSIKASILASNELWDAGFKESGGVSGMSSHIPLRSLRRDVQEVYGIMWTNAEINVIYSKLRDVFGTIQTWLGTREPDVIEGYQLFEGVLEEMRFFLEDEQLRLDKHSSYEQMYRMITERCATQRGYIQLIEGICSSNQSRSLTAVNEMIEELYYKENFKHHAVNISAVWNKILLQAEPALEECLQYMSVLVFRLKDKEFLKQFEFHLIEILKKFYKEPLTDADQASVEEQLVRIAYVLQSWGRKDEIVMLFLDKLQTSAFNNVRYTLRQIIEQKTKLN